MQCMDLDQIHVHLNEGSFDQALELINEFEHDLESGGQVSNQKLSSQILKTRILYHRGKIEESKNITSHLIENYQNEEIDELLNCQLMALHTIFLFGLGENVQASLETEKLDVLINGLNPQNNTSFDLTLSFYHYAKGLSYESEGMINEALGHFQKSSIMKEQSNSTFELNFVYYKIGTMYRLLGQVEQSKKYLLKSLSLSEKLNLKTEIATSATLLGQDLMMGMEYSNAREYIEKGLKNWEDVKSTFGSIWALGELAILTYLEGNIEQAIEIYEQLYDKSRGLAPSYHLSNHLFNLIKFSLEIDDQTRVSNYLNELEKLTREGHELINLRYNLARAVIESKHNRIINRLKSVDQFKELAKSNNYLIKLEALINHCQLLVMEYKITEDQVIKNEILEETDDKINQILDFIRIRSNLTYEMHTAVLRSEIELLRADPEKAKSILADVMQITELEQIQGLKRQLDKISSEVASEIPDLGIKFQFTKELHSIPKLKVMLYLLPRYKVSFTELVKGSGLSSGNLLGQCEKLESLGYIAKDNLFIDNKPVTTYELTPHGYSTFKNYMTDLSRYLNQQFS